MWWRNKNGDLIILEQSILTLKTRIDNLDLSLEKLRTDLLSIRGLINRKLSTESNSEDQSSRSIEKPKSEDINSLNHKFL